MFKFIIRKVSIAVCTVFYNDDYKKVSAVLSDYTKNNLHALYVQREIIVKVLISGEDHRFYYHPGFDVIAILRAIRNRIAYKKREGASTIEQQLVRVITNDFRRGIGRKIKEIFLAMTVTDIIPKKYIPLVYLEIAYYGRCMNNFNGAVKKLDISEDIIPLHQAVKLVSRIKYPQPGEYSEKRHVQIENRELYLTALYHKHLSYKFIKIY